MIAADGDGRYVSSSFLSQMHKSPFVYNLFKFIKISDDDLVYVIKYKNIIMARFRRYIACPPFGSCPICCMIDSRGRFTRRVVCSCLFDVTGNHTPMACDSIALVHVVFAVILGLVLTRLKPRALAYLILQEIMTWTNFSSLIKSVSMRPTASDTRKGLKFLKRSVLLVVQVTLHFLTALRHRNCTFIIRIAKCSLTFVNMNLFADMSYASIKMKTSHRKVFGNVKL